MNEINDDLPMLCDSDLMSLDDSLLFDDSVIDEINDIEFKLTDDDLHVSK